MARKVGRIHPHALLKAAVLGRVRVQIEPGESIRYCREDVERLASEARREKS